MADKQTRKLSNSTPSTVSSEENVGAELAGNWESMMGGFQNNIVQQLEAHFLERQYLEWEGTWAHWYGQTHQEYQGFSLPYLGQNLLGPYNSYHNVISPYCNQPYPDPFPSVASSVNFGKTDPKTPDPILPDYKGKEYHVYPKYPNNIDYQFIVFYIEAKKGAFLPAIPPFTISVNHTTNGESFHVSARIDSKKQFRYSCAFQGRQSGIYRVSVQIWDRGFRHVYGSPFNIPITRNYYAAKLQTISYGIPKTPGKTTTRVRTTHFGAIDADPFSGKIYTTDSANNVVRILTTDGKIVREVGYGISLFSNPGGITVDLTNKRILVADTNHHRICICTMDAEFIHSFGKQGKEDGEFHFPWGVDTSPNGLFIVVADSWNHRVQLFDIVGNFLTKFQPHITYPLHRQIDFDLPMGICFDNTGDKIYITDYNRNALVKFSSKLTEKVELSPERTLLNPRGICMDDAGNAIICDSGNDLIRVFDSQGALVTFLDMHVKPQDVGILPGGHLVILEGKGKVRVL